MEQKKKTTISKAAGWGMAATFAILGLLMLFFPEYAPRILVYGLAAVLGLVGLYNIVVYIKEPPKSMVGIKFSLALGLSLLALGIVIAIFPWQLLDLFLFLTGAAMIASCFVKLQLTLDARRADMKFWWAYLTGSMLSLIFGVIITAMNPTLELIGSAMLLEAVMDAVVLLMLKFDAPKPAVAAPVPAPAPAPAPVADAPKPETADKP